MFSCGDNQVCVQLESDNNMGRCQCLQGYDKQDDGVSFTYDIFKSCLQNLFLQSCMSLKDEDEMLAKERQEFLDKKPLPVAKDSGFIESKTNVNNPSPQVGGGNSGGAIAAGVVSVLIVILLVTGFTYMITRTRLLPRLRAQITNKPYEDIIINDRGQPVPASSLNRHTDTNLAA